MTSDAKALIHDYAGGVPRSINNIATACLIHAASQNITAINESIVNDTMAEFKLP
jgi:general secretion pathway protein A